MPTLSIPYWVTPASLLALRTVSYCSTENEGTPIMASLKKIGAEASGLRAWVLRPILWISASISIIEH